MPATLQTHGLNPQHLQPGIGHHAALGQSPNMGPISPRPPLQSHATMSTPHPMLARQPPQRATSFALGSQPQAAPRTLSIGDYHATLQRTNSETNQGLASMTGFGLGPELDFNTLR
jgi:hypothetical protein